MNVRLLAATRLMDTLEEMGLSDYTAEADMLAEFAGRACYQSWSKPNPATRTNRDYLAHILEVGHFSVLEHSSVTFYITGVSRSLTHELVRHRHLSFSQLSQRYVNEASSDIVIPPAVANSSRSKAMIAEIIRLHSLVRQVYTGLSDGLADEGLPRKQAREAARAVLPGGTETGIVVSGNLRAWREFIVRRNTDAADQEIHQLAGLILERLKSLAPNTFQDMG